MPALTEQPGLLFVFATLLPLASFLALLLLGAVRWGLRPYAKENPGVDSIFQFLGGNVPGVGPAYCTRPRSRWRSSAVQSASAFS